MCKCKFCKYSSFKFNEDSTYGQYVHICTKDKTNFINDGLNCSSFEEILSKCNYCKLETKITSLKQGFCSLKCKNNFLFQLKQNLEIDYNRLLDINNNLTKSTITKSEKENLLIEKEFTNTLIKETNNLLKKLE